MSVIGRTGSLRC